MAATARGYQLRRWRYGPETEQLVQAALDREQWPIERWSTWQAERLTSLLLHAASNVPYYREHWGSDRPVDNRAVSSLQTWPILEKSAVRDFGDRFLSEATVRRTLCCTHTSGTTGTPLRVWQSRQALREFYALFEARARHWYGVSRQDRWAILGGQLVTPVHNRRPPFWVWNGGLRQLYMSSYHLAQDLCGYYVEALRRYQVSYILGYTSSLYSLAQYIQRHRASAPRMKVVIANAEPLFDYQRQAIGEAFQCPVRETYGMAEKVAAASECEFGRLHLWPEAGVVEVIDDDQPAALGEAGDLVATGLLGLEMPLVRYRCGDRIVLAADQSCECRRSLPIIQRIEGRRDDVLHTVDGREIGRLDPIFKAEIPIEEAQIIQESLQTVRVLYVPMRGFQPDHKQRIVDELRARIGAVQVHLEAVNQVPRTANGKFRAVISRLGPRSDEPVVR